jgi:hypothetical protein
VACGTEGEGRAGNAVETAPGWEEPSSYTYTLLSSEGERSLIGEFRVTVRNGKVTKATGLDASAGRALKSGSTDVPTLGDLVEQWRTARRDGAATAEIEYAEDGHPTRISLDWEENAIDDEALYVIRAYEPGAPGEPGDPSAEPVDSGVPAAEPAQSDDPDDG